MARATLAIVAVLGFAGILNSSETRDPAPRFSVKTLNGQKFTSDTLKGRVVLLQFWATWCRYCRGDQEAVDAIDREFADRGLLVLAINVGESKKTVKKYLDASPRSCEVVLTGDTNLSAIFAAKTVPMYVVLDREGKVAGTQRGAGADGLRRILMKAGLDVE